MRQTIEHNAATLRRLHQNLHEAFRRRQEDGGSAWRDAVNELNSRYDALAFPGGLSAAFKHLAAGDPVTAETAILFLEVHPYFFRSQYHATKFIRLLKKLQLRPDLQQRFDAILCAARQRKLRRSHKA